MIILLKVLSFMIWLMIMGALIIGSRRLYKAASYKTKLAWEKEHDKMETKPYLKNS